MSIQFVNAAPDFERKTLERVDAAMNNLVDVCSKETTSYREVCTDELEESWWTACAVYYDKLDTCKYGKLENFLKGEGRAT